LRLTSNVKKQHKKSVEQRDKGTKRRYREEISSLDQRYLNIAKKAKEEEKEGRTCKTDVRPIT